MRKSSERHPLAILRRIIGLSQPEFAELTGISESTVAKIESLRLPLSEENALLIESETGCSAQWLKTGDVTQPPVTSFSVNKVKDGEKDWFTDKPFTLEVFQWHRASKQAGLSVEEAGDDRNLVLASAIQDLIRACHSADKNGKRNYAELKLYNMVQAMSRELGATDPWNEEFSEYLGKVLDSVVFINQYDSSGSNDAIT